MWSILPGRTCPGAAGALTEDQNAFQSASYGWRQVAQCSRDYPDEIWGEGSTPSFPQGAGWIALP